MRFGARAICLLSFAAISCLSVGRVLAGAKDKIMGEIQFISSSKLIRTSGVWIDGQYVGYVGELKGSNRVRVLPGEHQVVVRQVGYTDFLETAVIEPGLVLDIRVNMQKDPQYIYPDVKTSSEVRFEVQPNRAAVFLDDGFVGHVDEYYGVARAMLVTPGKHRIKIALPGFKAFETDLDLVPHQKFTLKTNLMEASISDADPLVRKDAPRSTSSADPLDPPVGR